MTLVGSSTIRQNENIRKKAPQKKKEKKVQIISPKRGNSMKNLFFYEEWKQWPITYDRLSVSHGNILHRRGWKNVK